MTNKKEKQLIEYIRKESLQFEIPEYKGERYEALVPDTLELQERAALAINGLTGPTDPEADYEIYWYVFLHGNRPVMSRDLNHQVQLVMQRALPLMRIISGSEHNMEVERRWLEVLLHLQGPDGLLYYPLKGRPWISYKGTSGGQYDDFEGDQYTGPLNNGLSLAILGHYYRLTGDELFKEVGEKLVSGMARQAVHREDYAFYPKGIYGLGEVSNPDSPIPTYVKSGAIGWATSGIVEFYMATGYEPALTMAGELARFLWKHSQCFDADGNWLMPGGHFPWHCGCLLGLLGEKDIVLNDVPVTIGSRENGGVPTKGVIDEVMIFKKALNAQEVQQIYQAKGVAEILGQPSAVQPGGKLITTWSIIKSGYMR